MRIGINVPNDLLNRVKAVQPPVNISRVCRESLTKLADNHDLAVERVRSDGTVERVLRFFSEEGELLVEPDWVGYALDDAAAWVSNVSPDDWDEFWARHGRLERVDGDMLWLVEHQPRSAGTKGWHERHEENGEWIIAQYDEQFARGVSSGRNITQECRQEYGRAWLSYVEEVRRQQLAYIEAKRQALLAEWEREKEEAMRSRQAPELPPQLQE